MFVSADDFDRAWQLRQKYHDKPDVSFVDLTSMAVFTGSIFSTSDWGSLVP